MSRHVPAAGILVSCIDWRFTDAAFIAARSLAGGHGIDPYPRPGATKRHHCNCAVTRDVIENIAAISIAHHGAMNLYIAHHADCLAYGGSEAFSSAEEERAVHVLDMRAGKKLFTEEVLAYAEILVQYGDISPRERSYLERALNGGFKVTSLFLSPPPGCRSFTADEVRADILED